MRVLGRRHYNPLSLAMQEATRRIVTALAERFGENGAVIGWQIDNEFKVFPDQSEFTQRAFQQWLCQRYETIKKLNAAWGLQFWNQQFDDFSQVKLSPTRTTPYGTPQYGNPHHVLDSSRFISYAFAQFNKLQADILRPRIGDRFITTNFMAFRPEVDPMAMAGELSLFSWDSYPVAGPVQATANDEYRIGDPATIGFVHDQMASYTGRWGLMELQPGQTNWGGYPVLPYPGAIHLWIWTALAHGAEFVTTYRYRQPLWGLELFHAGLVGTDGVTPSPGGRQFIHAIDELKRIDAKKWNADGDGIDPDKTVGLVLDFEQLWEFEALPQANKWSQPKWLTTWYAAIARLGLRVRILHPKRDWPSDLKLIVVPGMQMVDDEDVSRMKRYVDGGGHLVLTCRTALMDRN
jgi:beta-galactosidase